MRVVIRNISLLFITGIFIVCSSNIYSQVLKFKSTEYSLRYSIGDGSWSDWSDFEETSVLITFDIDKERFTIYSKNTQVYDIAKYEDIVTTIEGEEILTYYCVDNSGLTCYIKLIKPEFEEGQLQLQVYYNDFNWLYNIYKLD